MSKETDAIFDYLGDARVPARITPNGYWRPLAYPSRHAHRGTTGKDGTNHSLALDLAHPGGSGWDTPELKAIFDALWPARAQLRELFYTGPGVTHNVYRGQVVPVSQLPSSIRAQHHNHVHAAAEKGTFIKRAGAPKPPASVNLQDVPVAIATNPKGDGYWELYADGGVFTNGKVAFYGSLGGSKLNAPVVDLIAHPSGKGYWIVVADGGVFTFGNADFYGSMGGKKLAEPVMGGIAHPSGKGYWLQAEDGGIFSFGAAKFLGRKGRK